MAIKDIMESLDELNGPAVQATSEELMLAAADIKVDDMFDYERPMVHSNINEA
ncbi:hypothetical protein [Micromonospora sp. CPCC 205561]|uniref:hypothetical protein n=1 Tax=Micromonospora sp. CPCC 205561 TaxID=3122407 RepID=UPI002FF08F69